jgi:hypothetical protein
MWLEKVAPRRVRVVEFEVRDLFADSHSLSSYYVGVLKVEMRMRLPWEAPRTNPSTRQALRAYVGFLFFTKLPVPVLIFSANIRIITPALAGRVRWREQRRLSVARQPIQHNSPPFEWPASVRLDSDRRSTGERKDAPSPTEKKVGW